MCRYECVFVHCEAAKCDGLVTQTMESYGARASQLFNLTTWADAEKRKENAEEKRCQYTTCAVCLTRPSITAYLALTLPDFCYHEPTYTHKYTYEVTGLCVACPRGIMR